MAHTIIIPDSITVSELSTRLNVPVSQVITQLIKNGMMVTLNERIDIDIAQIVVSELDLDIELVAQSNQDNQTDLISTTSTLNLKKPLDDTDSVARPPVVAVMGHVDHGKTSLLDKVSNNNVVNFEAGGITQHISAFQIKWNDRLITFLDTPGHEAFASLREHGAMLTDIVLLVVAADDGVKPQTLEAIRFAKKAQVKIIVAITKIDKPTADSNRIKQQLAENGLNPEEWGGDTIILEVSSKTGQGVNELLDMLLLVSDVEELKASIKVPACGVIIEAHIENGRGPVAHGLIEQGQLHPGEFIVAGATYAKVKNLEATLPKNEKIAIGLPSMPVAISGFKSLPEFGQEFHVVKNEKEAREQVNQFVDQHLINQNRGLSSNEMLRIINRNNQLTELNVILKADVQGSLTSVIDSLKSLETEEVAVRIVGSGVGSINANDLHLAKTSHSIIYGFNVIMPSSIRQQAIRDKLDIKSYKVIYELIDDVKLKLEKLLQPQEVETKLGVLKVKGIFSTTKSRVILGGEVISGKLSLPAFARLYRDKKLLADNLKLVSLKNGPMDVASVEMGQLCGLSLDTDSKLDVLIEDNLEFYNIQIIERHL